MFEIKNCPLRRHAGVVIAGAGVAGVAAALGAARAGAKVLLLEKSNAPGGMAGPGLIAKWMAGTCSPLQQEIDRRVAQSLLAPPHPANGLLNECIKSVLLEMLGEAGVELLLDCRVVDAECSGNRVTAVFAESVGGIERIEAPLFIDATGDGTLAARAGAEYTVGREGDHLCQGASLMFHLGGVDPALLTLPESFDVAYRVPAGDLGELAKKYLTPPAGHVILHHTGIPGVICANMTNAVKFDFTKVAERTQAELVCRRQIAEIIPFLRRYAPGFTYCYLAGCASQLGVRESRHFVGDYQLNEEDIRRGRLFADWIAVENRFPFDIHNVQGMGLDAAGELDDFTARDSYSIPLRACLPAGLDGLLLAGRNISGTHKAHSSFRVMPIALNIGLGVGVAASVALLTGKNIREVEFAWIHRELGRQKVKVPAQACKTTHKEVCYEKTEPGNYV